MGVTICLALAPFHEGVESWGVLGDKGERFTAVPRTLVEANGPVALVPMLVPVVLTALPLLRHVRAMQRRLYLISAALLLAFVTVGGLSIGLFYAPSAMAMLIAAVLATVGHRPA